MNIKSKKGFTLIELMVVVVIIGILSAIAIPKMLNMGDKAKASEAPNVISTWERLQSAYGIEKGSFGTGTAIQFTATTSKYFTYDAETTAGTITAAPKAGWKCVAADTWVSVAATPNDPTFTHTPPATAACAAYTPSF